MARRKRRAFGELSERPSRNPNRPSRWRARYVGPDGNRYSDTFDTRELADGYLRLAAQQIDRGTWAAPRSATAAPAPALTFAEYAEHVIQQRETRGRRPIRASTAALYRKLVKLELAPALGSLPVALVSAEDVREWHETSTKRDNPTQTANAYLLLRSIFRDATEDGLTDSSPCRLKGAGRGDPVREGVTLSPAELATYLEAIPEPRYRWPLAIASVCGLRSGEVRALRAADYEPSTGRLAVVRTVSRINGSFVFTEPKTAAGRRAVYVPPHLRAGLAEWLKGRSWDELMFPAGDGRSPLHSSTLNTWHKRAAQVAGHPEMTIHDLRRTALTAAAQEGATVSELMRMAGHTTPAVAMIYQRADDDRMARISEGISHRDARRARAVTGKRGNVG